MDQITQSKLDGETVVATAQIVAAAINFGLIATTDEISGLVVNVRNSLSGAEPAGAGIAPQREPAVSVRSSVKKDHIVCLECGEKMKMIKRHLNTAHGLSVDEYKERWNLSADYPLVAPDYAEVRRDLALKIGLGRTPGQKRGRKKKAPA